MTDGTHGQLAYMVKSSVVVADVTGQREGTIHTVATGHFATLSRANYRSVAINSAGAAVAVWGVGGSGAVMAAYRPADGAWGTPVVLAASGYTPVVRAAITASGEAAVMWADGGDGKPGSLTAAVSPGDGTWTTTAKLPIFEWVTEPSLTFSSDGASIVFGGETRVREVIVAAARVADGSSLGTVSLDHDGCNQGSSGPVDLVPSPDGTISATWCRAAGAGEAIIVADLSVAGPSLTASTPHQLGVLKGSRINSADGFATVDAAGTSYITWQAVTGPNVYVATRKPGGNWTVRHRKLSGVITPLSDAIAATASGALLGFEIIPDTSRKLPSYAYSVATLSIGASGALAPPRKVFTRAVKGPFGPVYRMGVAALGESDGRVLVIRYELAGTSARAAKASGFQLAASFSAG
jgi:hypothetical protein